jgi:STE24 endopeptidase
LNEDKASRYHRLKRHSAVIAVALTGMVLGGLLLSGASRVLADAAAAWAQASPGRFSPAGIAIYVALLAAVQGATAFPLTYYRGFFLEHRYGLSSEDAGGWLRDHAKGALLALLFALAAAETVYFFLTVLPGWWWLASAAVFAAVMFGLAKLLPLVVLPIFYKFTPLDRESLRARLTSLSERAGVPVLGIYEWGLGEKTRRANAALVGTGGTRRIIVSDTLLAEYSDDEIEVILAHELAHHVHRDILTGLLVESALLLAAFYVAALTLGATWERLGLRSPSDVAGLPLLVLAAGAVNVAATPVVNALSRWNERRADRYALALTKRPAAFISAMKRLATQNLADERPSRAVLWLFHTHPPIEQRIEAARRLL